LQNPQGRGTQGFSHRGAGRTIVSRKAYWSFAAAVLLFLILLNSFKVQDLVAAAFGYKGSAPMFELDQMICGSTADKVFDVLTAYGESGSKAYTFLLRTCDLVFPFLYGSFYFCQSAW